MMDSYELYRRGREAMNSKKFEEAITLFQDSIQVSPHFKSLELLGECFIHTNQPIKAIVPLAAATAMNKSVRPPSLLAETYFQLGEYDNAEMFVEKALRRDGNNLKAKQIKQQLQAARSAT